MTDIVAMLWPAGRIGVHLIEVPTLGIRFEHEYSENRMAKVLDLAGIQGTLYVHDCKAGFLRSQWSIATEARCRFSEGRYGFKREPWTEGSLRPLREHAAKVRRAAQRPRSDDSVAQVLANPEHALLAPSASEVGTDRLSPAGPTNEKPDWRADADRVAVNLQFAAPTFGSRSAASPSDAIADLIIQIGGDA